LLPVPPVTFKRVSVLTVGAVGAASVNVMLVQSPMMLSSTLTA
jgi:hypothetical protein